MTNASPAPPPRLLPDRPFPDYAYHPGRTPHPTRDPGGHSYRSNGAAPSLPPPPDPADWRRCEDYLYGIDLFNHGFFWEAHEAWEGLWAACGRGGPTADFLQALINLAAVGFKARLGNARGMRANAGTALRLFRSAAGQLGRVGGVGGPNRRYMGLDLGALVAPAGQIARNEPVARALKGQGSPLAFDLVLRPD